MALANGMRPLVLMLVVHVAGAGVNIFFKLAISSGVSVPVLIAYRFLLSSAVMVPLAFFFIRTGLMSVTGFFQSTVYALCVERDWSQWKLGWDIRLWTVAYSGTMGTALIVTLIAISLRLRGPLFVAVLNPLMLIIVALAGTLFLHEMIYLGSILGAILIVCGLYVVLWGKHKAMRKMSGLVSLEEIQTQKSLEIFVASGSNGSSPPPRQK